MVYSAVSCGVRNNERTHCRIKSAILKGSAPPYGNHPDDQLRYVLHAMSSCELQVPLSLSPSVFD
jgi:hypothetical protein